MVNKRIIAIIPARGGSKGIPRKNLRLFNGKPLISYVIKEALKCKRINRVIVSTDDKEIAKVSREYGAEVPFMRPKKISGDNASSLFALQHAITYLENEENYNPDIVVLTYPTSPSVKSSMFDQALEKMDSGNFDSIVSVSKDYKHYWEKNENGLMEQFYPQGEVVVRQLAVPLLKETGAMYIATRDVIMEKNNFFGTNVGFILVDEHKNIDIDTPYDFRIAEFVHELEKYKIKKQIKIGNKIIGQNHPIFIIAEAGVNHGGDFNTAYKMVKAAKKAGADAITFQHIIGEKLNSKHVKSKLTIDDWKKWELSDKQLKKLCNYAKRLGLQYSICVIDNESLDKIVRYRSSFIKIVSGDLTNIPFLRYCAKTKLPILLSTGGSTIKEVKEAINAVEEEGNYNIILYHTNSSYPTLPEEVNLRIMDSLKKEFDYPVGFCDHTSKIKIPVMAAARMACVIEKHLSLDRSKQGPDFQVSLHPDEFKQMVDEIRYSEKILGSSERKLLRCERKTIKLARRSIVSKAKIPKGATITKDMLILKRPGTGIQPRYLNLIIGKKTKEDIEENVLIKNGMLKD